MNSGLIVGTKKMVSMRLNLKLVDFVKKLLHAKDRTDAIEKALVQITEQEKFRRHVERTSGKLTLGGLP